MAKTSDVLSGAVLAALGIFIITEARQWEYLGPDGPGPGFFPMWYGIAMVALSSLLIATSIGQALAHAPRPKASEVGRALGTWAVLVACVALLKVLGFIVAFTLFTLFIVRFLYGEPLGKAAAIAVGGAVGFYLLFDVALNVGLPAGMLGF
ncbi:MAG: tripartite tricarboxylate transporter TctB family protein [Betaproteobacteria bacterium]|nr:tripartite tricarboxylate transporter TctB family protein [Betaproteobacteria bacterium]MBI2509741.1 tripartite tricarboxylate transporter TctB family protein [Betaproteobacteria bacterium]